MFYVPPQAFQVAQVVKRCALVQGWPTRRSRAIFGPPHFSYCLKVFLLIVNIIKMLLSKNCCLGRIVFSSFSFFLTRFWPIWETLI
jgi:hypothetical protein